MAAFGHAPPQIVCPPGFPKTRWIDVQKLMDVSHSEARDRDHSDDSSIALFVSPGIGVPIGFPNFRIPCLPPVSDDTTLNSVSNNSVRLDLVHQHRDIAAVSAVFSLLPAVIDVSMHA